MAIGKAGDDVGKGDAFAVLVERHLLVRNVDLDVRVFDIERFAVSPADDGGLQFSRVERPQPLTNLFRQGLAVNFVAHVQKLNGNVAVDLGFELILRVRNVVSLRPAVHERTHRVGIDRNRAVRFQRQKRLRLLLRNFLRRLVEGKLRRGLLEVHGQQEAVELVRKCRFDVKFRVYGRNFGRFVAVDGGELGVNNLRSLSGVGDALERVRDRFQNRAFFERIAGNGFDDGKFPVLQRNVRVLRGLAGGRVRVLFGLCRIERGQIERHIRRRIVRILQPAQPVKKPQRLKLRLRQ